MSQPRLEIRLDGIRMISVNQMYSVSRRYVRRSKDFIAFDDAVTAVLDETLDDNTIQSFKQYLEADDQRAICMTCQFYIPKRNYFSSDTTNFPKTIEDIIKFKINIDDSRNTKSIAEKFLSYDKDWHVIVTLDVYELSYDIPKGKWSDHILGKLPNNRILDVNNNVIKLTEEEIKERKNKKYKTQKQHPLFVLPGTDPNAEVNTVPPKTRKRRSSKNSNDDDKSTDINTSSSKKKNSTKTK